MSKDRFDQYLEASREAITTFLTTLLGGDQSVQLALDETPSVAASVEAGENDLYVVAREGDETRYLISMRPHWLTTFSQAMLGAVLEPTDEGADDLLEEVAGQAYGALRSRLGADNIKLPDVEFRIASKDESAEISTAATIVRLQLDSELGSLYAEVYIFDAPRLSEPSLHQAQSSMPRAEIAPAAFPELGSTTPVSGDGGNFELLAEVELEVTVELGRRRIPLADVLRLTTGSVIELEKLVGEPLEVYANGRLIAEGEAVVIDEQFGVRITNLVSSSKRTKAFI